MADLELGNIMWNDGNKNQEYDCPEHITALIEYAKTQLERIYWNIHQKSAGDLFDLEMSEMDLDIKGFKWVPYYWGDSEVQEYNFKYKDIEISWYKHFGRDMTINKLISNDEAIDMFSNIMNEIYKLEKKYYKENENV